MSDNKARGFLEDIIAHPDDNTPRLIFADWLEEKGASARAEFIRVQIERASLPDWDARQVRLWLRERALLEQHGRKWKGELPSIKGVSWQEFRRGFVATATISTFKVLQENAGACWAAAPLEGVAVRWPRHTQPKEIPGLRELSLTAGVVDHREVDRIANAPLLATVRALNIWQGHLGTEGFRRLMASPYLGNLRALRVPCNDIGNGGISALLGAVSLKSLEELDLSEQGSYGRYGEDPIIDADGLAALAGWQGMDRIRSLTLSGNDVRRAGLRALLRSPRAGGLKKLVLRGNGLTGPAMQEFGSARPELRLDVLDLSENLLRDRGAGYLAAAPCLRELKVLELDRCEMRVSSARRLSKAPFLGSLRRLSVGNNTLTSTGLRALLEGNPRELHMIQLHGNDLKDEGASLLAESPASDALLEVNLAWNRLRDRSAEALGNAKHLRNLLILQLNYNQISKPAAAALAQSPLGQRLAQLEATDPDEIPF